jgi:hypothetical protein
VATHWRPIAKNSLDDWLGTFAPYMTVHRDSVVKIDEDVPFETAAIMGCPRSLHPARRSCRCHRRQDGHRDRSERVEARSGHQNSGQRTSTRRWPRPSVR